MELALESGDDRVGRAEGVRTLRLGLDLLEESDRYIADLATVEDVPIHQRDIKTHREMGMRARADSRQFDVAVSERMVSVGARSVGLRQFLPHGRPRGGYLHFHGGGWVFGSASVQDLELADLCHDLGIAIFSVEYRLAPEHPFPAAMDDAETAARWLLRDGLHELEFESGLVVIGGASAGAQLAAIALQRIGIGGEPNSFCGANLDYGIFDLSMTPSQRVAADTPRLSRADLEWYYEQVMPSATAEDRRTAAISPLYGDLQGMPPARFTVGTLDPLFDDSMFMAARWAAAGSPATLEIYAAASHGFARQPNGLGILARQRESGFLARQLKIDRAELTGMTDA